MSSSSSRKPPRMSSSGGGRGGRGGRSSSRRGGRGSGGGRSNDSPSEEDVLIAFMPFMRSGNADARNIHERYGHDQRIFVHQVRLFLEDQKNPIASASANGASFTETTSENNKAVEVYQPSTASATENVLTPSSPILSRIVASTPTNALSPQAGKTPFPTPNSATPLKTSIAMTDLRDRMDDLFVKEDPILLSPPGSTKAFGSPLGPSNPVSTPPPLPFAPASPPPTSFLGMAPIGSSRATPGPFGMTPTLSATTPQQQQPIGALPPTPPSFNMASSSPLSDSSSPSHLSSTMPPQLSPSLVPPVDLNPRGIGTIGGPTLTTPNTDSAVVPPSGNWVPCAPGFQGASEVTSPSIASPGLAPTTPATPFVAETIKPQPKPTAPPPSTKKEHQPKRLWTRLEEQPGRLLANNIPPSNQDKTFRLRPRQELTAKWMLPLSYLRQRSSKSGDANKNVTLREALSSLAVGLFRQGCTENGSNVSIISKEILSPPEEARQDYPFDSNTDTVWGTVPFYSPRTPGHVVMRLFWQDEPLYTLATGPRLYVCVSNNADVEPTLRFILSNFKSKSRNNNTSLSSLHSLASVLEQFRPPREPRQQYNSQQNNYRKWEGAGRAAWGCICESKKVLEACAAEYLKTREKHLKLEKEVTDLQAQFDAAEAEEQDQDEGSGLEHYSESAIVSEKLREKKNSFMSGRASNERRWKDSQLAFASILKAVVNNQSSMSLLLKRDLLSELRLEYELWCPLCESFAPSPFSASDDNNDQTASTVDSLCVNRSLLPRPITGEHFRMCIESRVKMQIDTLGFQPNTKRIYEDVILTPTTPSRNPRSPNHGKHSNGGAPTMNPASVSVFNNLSSAMYNLYQDVYMTSDRVHQEREMVRSQIENVVAQCPAFPPGTKVVVFGSAANGFGSPTSDLDMCLQLPTNTQLLSNGGGSEGDGDDKTGAIAMAQLAELFEKAGLQNVDTARLTARIPVIKFYFPRQGVAGVDATTMECDLSMQNPLACLNTSLLLTYSRIHPMTTVLASIIKRWAKARDINNPSRHTLSSYGYILMLLHFLTYRQTTSNSGQVISLRRKEGGEPLEKPPLLPNLQWMDMNWPQAPLGTPYRELTARPKSLMRHPSEYKFLVNAYFYRLADQEALANLQRRFTNQDASVAILLASFFRYYAFEFDYKKYVVSLHSTAVRGLVEREVKAEVDCWRVYFQGLTIEDPFETFYDVAHVVKGSNFHRLRHELALAYTKIADAATFGTRQGGHRHTSSASWHEKDLRSMTGMDLIDWICEPVESEKEE